MKRLAILGNHLPRRCGIATFTTHLSDALTAVQPEVDAFVIAMNDAGRRHADPSQVRFEIAEADLTSYRREHLIRHDRPPPVHGIERNDARRIRATRLW